MQMQISQAKSKFILYLLLLVMPLVGMAVDLIGPSLPTIAKNLKVSEHIAQNLISTYVVGFAIGAFVIGFLSDAWGRRRLICLSMFVFVIVSILPTCYPNIHLLLAVRVLQGITIGAASVLVRTIVADLLPPEKLVKFGPTLGIMWGIGPVIGPLIGSLLLVHYGWQACFIFFALVAAILFILIYFFVPETHLNRQLLEPKLIMANIAEVVKHKQFMGLMIIMSMMYSIIATFHSLCPFLIQNIFLKSPLFFGKIALSLGVFYLASSILCRILVERFLAKKLLLNILNVFTVFASINLIVGYFYPYQITIIIVASSMMFFLCAVIYPLAMGIGMSLFKHIAGAASSVMFSNVAISSLVAYAISFIHISNSLPIFIIYWLLTIASAIIYWLLVH